MAGVFGTSVLGFIAQFWLIWVLLANPASTYSRLSSSSLRHISSGGSDFDIDNGALLAPILIPRVPGTLGSAKAQHHFVDFFTTNLPLWTLEWHNSTSTTPATGEIQVPFTNMVFRRDPPWARPGDVSRLTLVAHYDTLYRPDGFIGAIDSAASCAILMHVARSLDEALTKKWEAMEANSAAGGGWLEEEKGIQIILLDGEEAWVSWTDDDSLYGARALAETWATSPLEEASVFSNRIESIGLFVLLDLLGAARPSIPSYFEKTHWAYSHLAAAEERLRGLGLLETKAENGLFLPDREKKSYQFTLGYILDDHVPFLERGVDILHLIPTPFPPVWHTMDDDGAHLDIPTVKDWAKIMSVFVAEWMELDGLVQPLESKHKPENKSREKSEL